MGRAKLGKSMSLGNFAKNAVLAGHSAIIFTCEMGAEIYSDRLDAAFSETMMDALGSKPSIVAKAVKEAEARTKGRLIIEDFPSGTLKPSMMLNVIEHHKQKGQRFDLCVMDYLDIFAPEHSSGVAREDSRQIWIDSRAIMQGENMAGLSATQTNREGAKASVATMTDVAEDFNKARTADVMLSINATEAEVKANKARLVAVASRNQKEFTLDIEQDRATMRFIKKVLGVRL
jgi:replicative DNA helicase